MSPHMGVYKMIKLSFIWTILFEHGFMQTIFYIKTLEVEASRLKIQLEQRSSNFDF